MGGNLFNFFLSFLFIFYIIIIFILLYYNCLVLSCYLILTIILVIGIYIKKWNKTTTWSFYGLRHGTFMIKLRNEKVTSFHDMKFCVPQPIGLGTFSLEKIYVRIIAWNNLHRNPHLTLTLKRPINGYQTIQNSFFSYSFSQTLIPTKSYFFSQNPSSFFTHFWFSINF